MKKIKLFLAACAVMGCVGVNAQTAQTIVNGDMSEQWTTHTRVGAPDDNWGQATKDGVNCFETWRGHGTTSYEMSQEVTLPAGNYVFQCYAFYRKGGAWNTNPSASDAVIFAGTAEKAVWSLGGIPLSAYPTDQNGAASQFANGYYMNTIEFTLESEQTISIGCKGTHTDTYSWFVMGPASLYKVDNAGITGSYYLKNSGNGEYLFSGNDWGTHAITNATGYDVKIAAMSGGYSVDSHVTNGGKNHFLAGEYTDGAATALVFTPTGTNNEYYVKTPAGKYITAGASGANLTLEDASSDNAKWKLESLAEHNIIAAATYESNVASLDAATNASPVDATFYIPYATLLRNNQRAYAYWNGAPALAGGNPNPAAECYNKNFDVCQTVTGLKEGKYSVTVNAFYRAGGNHTDATTQNAIFYANDKETPVLNSASNNSTTDAIGDAATMFKNGDYLNGPITLYIADGTLTLGIKKSTLVQYDWTAFNYFKLTYYGNDVVTEDYANALIATIPTSVPTAVATNLNSLKTTLQSTLAKSDYDNLATAIESANNSIIPTYNNFLTVKANVVALKSQTTKYTDPGTAESTFDAAVAAQQTAVDEATTAAAIETAIVNLRKAASAFAGNVNIAAGQYLDLTDAMLYNASMRNSGDLSLWTILSNTNASYPRYANNCSEFWNANFDFYQTAYGLPAGNYNIEVSAFHRAAQEGSTYHTYLYANSDQVLVLPLANGENSTAGAETSFNNGLYTNSIKITLDKATDVNIGFKNEDTAEDLRENGAATDKWTIFRDFKIKYFGSDALALYRDEYESALNTATEALTDATYTHVAGTDRSNLSTAVTETYPTSVVEVDETQEKFVTATATLTSLTTTFKNGVASWNTYANSRAGVTTAKAEADLLSTSIYTGLSLTEPATAAEAASKAATDEPAIRVATYNYVNSTYTYSLTSKIGDFSTWTSTATVNSEAATAQTLDSEHWSTTTRTYYEQASTGWGSDAWTVQYQKIANNLPAGNYVLKLAARGSADINGTIASSATASTVTLPTAFNNTRGITTSGAASWSDSDTFRKSAGASTDDNKGAGWQWRFLPFTVSEAGNVTLTISVEAAQKYQWVSLADAELLSDEDKTTKLTLDEAYDMASTISANDDELATVTWKRNIISGYNTVVLPFDLIAVQVQAVFGASAVVYSYSEKSENANSAELKFTTVSSGAITANVPVLVKATAASTENVIEGVTIEAPTTTTAVVGTNFDYVGVYDNTTFADGDYFMATKGGAQQIFQSNGTDTAKPFRAYFKKKTAATVKAALFIDGVATAIEGINADDNNDATIFNLAGQRVQKAQKGIYIVNGKKVLVK